MSITLHIFPKCRGKLQLAAAKIARIIGISSYRSLISLRNDKNIGDIFRHETINGYFCECYRFVTLMPMMIKHLLNALALSLLITFSINPEAQAHSRSEVHPQAPAPVVGLSATPDLDGHRFVDIAFTTPATAVDGSSIAVITGISISRDDVSIKELRNVPTSTKILFVDEDVPDGWHTYYVTTSDTGGHGSMASTRCYVGIERPTPPTAVSVTETGRTGEALVSWSRPIVGVNGNTIVGDLTYEVYSRGDNGEYRVIGTGIHDTEYVCRQVSGFVNYCVVAINDGGRSDYSEVFYTYIGVGREMPYKRSGLHGYEIYSCNNAEHGFSWRVKDQDGMPGAVDVDGRYFNFSRVDGNVIDGACATMMFEKVNVSEPDAALSFYVYKHYDSANELLVSLVSGGVKMQAQFVKISQLPTNESWNRVVIPLEDYFNKSVVIMFEGICRNAPAIAVDCVKVSGIDDCGLDVLGLKPQSIFICGGAIEVASPGTITIININGQIVAQNKYKLRVKLSPGVYLVRTDKGTRKVMIN